MGNTNLMTTHPKHLQLLDPSDSRGLTSSNHEAREAAPEIAAHVVMVVSIIVSLLRRTGSRVWFAHSGRTIRVGDPLDPIVQPVPLHALPTIAPALLGEAGPPSFATVSLLTRRGWVPTQSELVPKTSRPTVRKHGTASSVRRRATTAARRPEDIPQLI
jgi:hypothetical protein